jgi:hypothetical protein
MTELMTIRSKYFVFLSMAGMLATSIYVYFMFNREAIAISAGSLGLFVVTLLTYIIVNSLKTGITEPSLKNNTDVTYRGNAVYSIDDAPVSGTLYLLKDNLTFQNTGLRKVKHEIKIPLSDIKEVSFAKTHRPHEKIIVIIAQESEYRFLVKSNQLWIDEIENAMMLDRSYSNKVV